MGAKIPAARSPRSSGGPGRQVALATGFCSMVPSIFGSTVCNLVHVALLAFGIARWFIDFLKICEPLSSFN